MRRVFLIVLDSLGVGALPDAATFGDIGTHTLDHVVAGAGGLDVPNLSRLGLGHVPGVTRVASIALYDEVQALHYPQAHAFAATLLVISFALLLTVTLLQRRRR